MVAFDVICQRISSAIKRLLGWRNTPSNAKPPVRQPPQWTFRLCPTVSSSRSATSVANVVALVGTADNLKWARLLCPCGCGEVLALNLMDGHSPRWTVATSSEGTVSIHPSIDATKCGAHFWIRDGRITWA